MSQGFISNVIIPLPLAVASGGTGQSSSTGTGVLVLGTAPTISQPNLVGTTTNNNAAAGSVGELISSVVATPGGALTNVTPFDVTTISLTAGDWDVYGNVYITPGGVINSAFAWISLASATLPDGSLTNIVSFATGTAGAVGLPAPFFRASLSGTTTIYLGTRVSFTVSATAAGGIFARRVR